MARHRPGKNRTLPLLPSLVPPPDVRLTNATAMRSEWVDPDDVRPTAARTAKTITGYRGFCPLRRMRDRFGAVSGITAEHIAAADHLRQLMDAAVIGFQAPRDLDLPVTALFYRPSTGPSRTALKQAAAWAPLLRALRLFTPAQRELLEFVVLRNRSLQRWIDSLAKRGLSADQRVEKGRLLAILDILTVHFQADIAADAPRGPTTAERSLWDRVERA